MCVADTARPFMNSLKDFDTISYHRPVRIWLVVASGLIVAAGVGCRKTPRRASEPAPGPVAAGPVIAANQPIPAEIAPAVKPEPPPQPAKSPAVPDDPPQITPPQPQPVP